MRVCLHPLLVRLRASASLDPSAPPTRFSPERVALQKLIDSTQEYCTGCVRMKLLKGVATCVGRKSPYSLYNQKLSSFEDDEGLYDQKDAAGFIKLNALRLRTLGQRKKRMEKK